MMHLNNLLIACALVMYAIILGPTLGQNDVSDKIPVYSYRQLGSYRMIGDAPVEMREFRELIVRFNKGINPYNVKLNPDGNLDTRGELSTTRRRYSFATSFVGIAKKRLRSLTFKTVSINGISYGFEGRLPYPPRFNEDMRHFIGLEGTLTKFKSGKKIAETYLELGHYAFE